VKEQPTLETKRLVLRPLMAKDDLSVRELANDPRIAELLAKLGMRQEGVLREFAPKGNGFEDAVLVSLLRREWEGKGEKQKLGKQKAESRN
jgi:RimJ/RimL family protein N-acetyltransferase